MYHVPRNRPTVEIVLTFANNQMKTGGESAMTLHRIMVV